MDHLSVQPVTCYSGSTYAERPAFLVWQGQRLEITAVEGQYRSPDGHHFRVRTRDGSRFELYYDEFSDEWQVDAGQ